MFNSAIEGRLKDLREELKKRDLFGFVVPLTDEHQSEYVASYAQRLRWLTNFNGTAGMAIVTLNDAAIFVDGRYTIQVTQEVDPNLFTHCHLTDNPPLKWIAARCQKGAKIGYDPQLHTVGWVKTWRAEIEKKGAELASVTENPVDAVWTDQPDEPNTPIFAHPLKYAGRTSQEKRAEIAAHIAEQGADYAVLSSLDSVAWLFNIRSSDVLHTPVGLSYALLSKDGTATFFVDSRKLDSAIKEHLGNQVELREKTAFFDGLKELGKAKKNVLVDVDTASSAIIETLANAGAKITKAADPCALPKAIKNSVELKGARDAHIRDGAAISKFLHWLSVEAPKGGETELSAAARLRAFRDEDPLLRDISFRTISGAGPNGAVVHYTVSEETNRPIELNSIYLVDSGGQYLDGTTDITRTIAVGAPTDEQRDRFTRVLKGHIALATAKFPKGTTGSSLDPIARRPLWDVGLDYDHGTGHGVGSFLAVHEGPGRIAKGYNPIALEPGMIFSNEPGYYKSNEYGIRIENLVIVTEARIAHSERDMLGFETITLAPIDKNLIATNLLSSNEKDWLNAYHADVRKKVGPLLSDKGTKAWFDEATAPL